MDKKYWKEYYNKHKDAYENSTFAEYVIKYLDKNKTLIDLGCGNGRDSIFFSKKLNVVGYDQCENIISHINSLGNDKLEGVCGDLSDIKLDKTFDYAYSRFSLHSITKSDEDKMFLWVKKNIKEMFFIETRSDFDKLTKIDTDHSRRFINMEKLLQRLCNYGFKIKYAEISDNFAIYNSIYNQPANLVDKNPKIIRIVCYV
jgi:hypothetical protein